MNNLLQCHRGSYITFPLFEKLKSMKQGESMIKTIFMCVIGVSLLFSLSANAKTQCSESVEDLKLQILTLAQTYQGLADPDQTLQNNLDVLVDKLLQKSAMPPVKDRIELIAGAWKQVWGPYDYRNDDGGVDPTIGVNEIYQVVSKNGYYYNVAPYYPNGDKNKEQISLLRGEYVLDTQNPNLLNVKFTDYPGVDPRPVNTNIWELAEIAENGMLENEIVIVPSEIVKIAFKGGSLEEVYTDQDIRLLYGRKLPPSTRRFLYVMSRVK